ncbi:MAG: sensor signal transduction histidine kinase [Ferruginibacter sp.]|nr:sensor signal transduction histidine kinase [Ferruginibacter sp.]
MKAAPNYYFFEGGGEMGELIRSKDWDNTSLGDPAGWPQSLRTMVAVMLGNPFGMYIAWGHDYIQLYNDGYRPILGATKHPQALGISTRETFSEIWHIISSMFDGVMSGEAVGFPDFMLPLNRNGFVEECYFDFSYSPVRLDDGSVGGVLVTVIETTSKKKAQDALKEAFETTKQQQRLYDSVTNNTPDLIYVFDLSYCFTYVNEAMLHLLGKSAGEVLGKSFRAIGYGESQVMKHEAEVDEVLATGKPVRGTITYTHHTLGLRSYDYIFAPVFNESGTVEAIAVTGRDITDIKQAQDAIKESQTQLAFAIDAAELGIWDYNPVSKKFQANSRMWDWLGFKENEVLDLPAGLSAMREADTARVRQTVKAALESGVGIFDVEFSITHRYTGRQRIVLAKGKATIGKDGIPARFNGTLQDVTKQALASRHLAESEQRFVNLVRDAAAAIVVLTGPEMKVDIVNDAYGRLINLTADEMIGQPLFSLIPEAADYYLPMLNKVRLTGEMLQLFESPYAVTVHGKYIEGFLHVVYQPYRDSSGKTIGVMAIMQDVTEAVLSRKKTEESEQRFQAAVAAVQGILWTNNGQGEMEGEQPGWASLTGQPYGDYQGTGWLQAVHPDDAQPTADAWAEAVQEQKRFIFEHRLRLANGEWRTFSVRAIPIVNEDGSLRQWVGVHTDVTEQRAAQHQVEESEKRFHNLIYSSPSAIAILEGTELVITMANDAILQIWGRGKEIIGMKYFDAMPGMYALGDKKIFDDVYNSGRAYTAIERPIALSQNGNSVLKYYNFIVYPQRNIHNQVNGIGIIATEVTSQAIINYNIRASEERFRSLAQTLPQLVWITDALGNPEFASARWKEYTGVETGEEIDWKAIVHPDDYEQINARWTESLATGKIYISEVRLKNKEGQYRWHAVRGEAVLNEEKEIEEWVGAFTDIHEQKLQDERKDEFISIASHEMKTPLTSVKGYLQILEHTLAESNEAAVLYAKKARQAADRLNELIGELLDVSKIRLGKIHYTSTEFDFDEMIDSTVENMQLTSIKHRIVKTGKIAATVTGDKERLQQVVINLLSNAIKYSPGESEIFIQIAQEENKVCVSVRDRGIGIAQQSLDRIFEKYHRVEEHAVHFQGLGIGLFICYEIIARHHGRLWAESEPGKGSTFYFTIPLDGKEDQEKATN